MAAEETAGTEGVVAGAVLVVGPEFRGLAGGAEGGGGAASPACPGEAAGGRAVGASVAPAVVGIDVMFPWEEFKGPPV